MGRVLDHSVRTNRPWPPYATVVSNEHAHIPFRLRELACLTAAEGSLGGDLEPADHLRSIRVGYGHCHRNRFARRVGVNSLIGMPSTESVTLPGPLFGAAPV